MSRASHRRERGIALIQVLLVTGIIGLLMLQMGLTARDQVARAQALADRAELQLAAQSREAAMLYSLLTEPMVHASDSENPYTAAWNFQGEPFVVDGITFSIQDESGRMRLPDDSGDPFERLLLALEVEPARARQLALELMVAQGTGSALPELGEEGDERETGPAARYPFQDLGQLEQLPGMDPELYRRLKPLLTLYPTPGFNPTTAPAALLRARMTKSQAGGVADAREGGGLNDLSLWKLTGFQADETTVLAPGPGLSLRLDMSRGETRLERTTTYVVRPYSAEPLATWQRSSGAEQDDDR
jgi:general secretion pathway protein K